MAISRNSFIRALAAPAVLFLLVGCAQQPSENRAVTPTSASVQPVSMTEQEALAAAQKAYADYLAMSDLIAQEGGVDPERMSTFVSKDLLRDEISGFQEISDNGWNAEGQSTFDHLELQDYSGSNLTSYLCIDHSRIRLFNKDLVDVTSPSRVDRYPLQVSFVFVENSKVVIESSETWVGENFC